ncbi:4-(cytidine 5'-diphospho)-2-C-methyl-D-erythritol kinase [Microbacterium sp.]|uniref:4-(cytidine 5'-diphospho)-2-C-methyl-D-erythritol kinase n=1 Tax=Microbacterium sp. TaxID=51671 RepID=UPI003A83E26C
MSTPASADRVVVQAPGKLNLFFAVGAAQPDGYHDVASVYQAVSVFEEVTATPADEVTISVSGSVDVDTVPLDDRNLAVRAVRLLARETGYRGGARLHVDKHVPVAGGMGGGSADAAAALVACDALWGTGVPSARLHELAARLGADVPFALHGGTAIGTGRGDRLSPALAHGRFDWVLAFDDGGLSTPVVYAELDRLRAQSQLDIAPKRHAPEVDHGVLRALRLGDAEALARVVGNDLQQAACALHPALATLLDAGVAYGALAGLVSGSGPTVAFLVPDADAGAALAGRLTADGRQARHVHGPVRGARVISA